jgi:hypothetical protein
VSFFPAVIQTADYQRGIGPTWVILQSKTLWKQPKTDRNNLFHRGGDSMLLQKVYSINDKIIQHDH